MSYRASKSQGLISHIDSNEWKVEESFMYDELFLYFLH